MSNALIEVSHDLRTNTITLTHVDGNGVRCSGRGFSPLQIDDFKLAAGEHAQKYIDLAGWTPEYIAGVKAAEEAEAKAKQDQADAEEAERKKAEKKKFDDAGAEQVAIIEAAMKKVKEKS